jgi:biopolymer transport protein ExbD
MSRQSTQTEDSVYMNVIPMVDIMFLLLLFFMLTADFGRRELEEVELSSGQTIKEDKQEEAKGRLTINIFHTPTKGETGIVCAAFDAMQPCRERSHWHVAIRGRKLGSKQLEQWALDAAADHKRTKEGKSEAEAKDRKVTTDLRVMVRADKRAPFEFVQVVMEKLGAAGIYRLEYGASEPMAAPGAKK